MEEVNKNVHLLKNLINAIEQLENEKKVRKFIEDIDLSMYPAKGPYAQCIYDLKQLVHIEFSKEEYLKRIKEICSYYLDLATGKKYNATKTANDYRKKHYKQLNVDIPKKTMEEFEKCLKENNKIKKEIILQWIEEYIEENQKK